MVCRIVRPTWTRSQCLGDRHTEADPDSSIAYSVIPNSTEEESMV